MCGILLELALIQKKTMTVFNVEVNIIHTSPNGNKTATTVVIKIFCLTRMGQFKKLTMNRTKKPNPPHLFSMANFMRLLT